MNTEPEPACPGCRFQPERTVHLAFGHDEEVGGDQGAAKISQLLKSRGVRLDILLDEGGLVAIDGLSPLTNAKIALVGTAEKVITGACMLSEH